MKNDKRWRPYTIVRTLQRDLYVRVRTDVAQLDETFAVTVLH